MSEPDTSAQILPVSTRRSMTEPLRTYVWPRGSRFEKSLYASRLSHQALPQKLLAMVRPSIATVSHTYPGCGFSTAMFCRAWYWPCARRMKGPQPPYQNPIESPFVDCVVDVS